MTISRHTVGQHVARQQLQQVTRRYFMRDSTVGLASIWLASQNRSAALAGNSAAKAASHSVPHFAGRVKRVIFLHMIGAPSQLELFDYKPELVKYDGKLCPEEYLEGQRFAFIQGRPRMLRPQFPFKRCGDSGAWVSDRLPRFREVVDDVCFIKSMHTDQFNHGPAQLMVHTGQARVGYPSAGAWATWGLGTENDNLPGFIVLLSGGRQPRVGKALWGSGFLPSVYQGVQCRSQGDPVLNVSNPPRIDREIRQTALEKLKLLNERTYETFGDPETLTRISQYEMAFRMQVAVPEAMDIRGEPDYIHRMYGTEPGKVAFSNNCLLARRLIERGVRFVQLFDWGWDSHGASKSEALNGGFRQKCQQMDQPTTALLKDLKQRGLLEDTLVIWSGEFGRTPMRENRGGTTAELVGRDHNPNAFTLWMAGGGVKAGYSHGQSDRMGYFASENPVTLRDYHATLLHLMGIDHDRFRYPFQGLEQRLTGVLPAKVVQDVLA